MLDTQGVQDLRKECELKKRKLSSLAEVSVEVYFARHNLRYKSTISRARFESLCADLFTKTMDITRRVLQAAKVSTATDFISEKHRIPF